MSAPALTSITTSSMVGVSSTTVPTGTTVPLTNGGPVEKAMKVINDCELLTDEEYASICNIIGHDINIATLISTLRSATPARILATIRKEIAYAANSNISNTATSSASSALHPTPIPDDFAIIQQFHTHLLSSPTIAEADLATPTQVTSLPFLWHASDIPERLRLNMEVTPYPTFDFMGRCKMTELLSTIRGLRTALPGYPTKQAEARFMMLLVYGTPGWGKSYMLAAAAVVLRRDFYNNSTPLRVVYLPDCGQLRRKPVVYMKHALLLAFAEDLNLMTLIHACSTVDDLINFCDREDIVKRNSRLLFLADQTNKLTAKNSDPDKKQKQKALADRLLREASFSHFLVEAISINDSNKEEVQQKQENRKELAMFGELSQAEWDAWLIQHRTQLPLPEEGSTPEELITKIAVETGRNLLFLSPFIRPTSVSPGEWTFAVAWESFIHLKEVSKIQRNLKDFVGNLQEQSYPSRTHALSFMTSAICKGPHLDMPNYYEARYFCVLDGIAHCVSQYIARCAASVIEEQCRLDLFHSNLWINTIRSHRSNPSVLGFLVEKAVLGYLSNIDIIARLLDRPDLRHHRVEVRTFKRGTESAALSSSSPVTLYIPEEFNYRAVDCVLRIIDRKYEKPVSQPTRKSKRGARGKGKDMRDTKKKQKTSTASSLSVGSSLPSNSTTIDADEESDDGDVTMEATDQDDDMADGSNNHATSSSSSSGETKAVTPASNDAPSTTVTLLPIQVTIASSISQSKRDRSFRFFERRAAWCDDFRDDPRTKIFFHFAFIVRRCAMQAPESTVAIGHDDTEKFQLTFFSLATIDEQLDRAVDSPSISSAKNNSPPRLQLAAAAASTRTD